MAGVEVDLSYHMRREFFDRDDLSKNAAMYSVDHHNPGMLPASEYSSVGGAEMPAILSASDRSFVSDVEGLGHDAASATSEEKIKSFASIFRANERPAINSYIMTVIQSDHDYSHHWSCNPDNKDSNAQPASVVTLFATPHVSKTNCWHNSAIQEHDDQDVDIESDWSDGVPSVPYNEKLACKLMLECERHMEFAGDDAAAVAEKQAKTDDTGVLSDTEEDDEVAGDDDTASKKDLNLCKTGWTAQQERAFDKAVSILDGERLARLACAGVRHEPARRRALLDRSASKFRQLLSGECRWELSLCRWLHNTLLHTLSSSYLISYLDILQSLSHALPSLMDKLLAPNFKATPGKKVAGGSAVNTPNAGMGGVSFSPSMPIDGSAANFDSSSSSNKFTSGHNSGGDIGDTAPAGSTTACSSRLAATSPGGALDVNSCSALNAVHADSAANDAKSYGFGGAISSLGLSLLLKRPWDPAMPILHANKPQSLGSGSAVVLLVPHCPQLCPASARRHKTFASTLHRVTTTVSVTVPPPPGGRLQEWLETVVAAVVTAVQEWQARGRGVVLAGWRAGGLLAAQIAAAQASVEGVVCLSPPFSGSADYASTAPLVELPASGQGATGLPLYSGAGSVTTADILCSLTCPLLLVVGDRAHNANVRAVEQLRERLSGGRSQLVVLRGADSELRLHPLQRYRAALTNSLVDRCIVDEIGSFISSLIVKEEATADAASASTVQEATNSPPSESPALSVGMEAFATDSATGELLVTAKRKACDEILLPDAANAALPVSPKKLRPETCIAADDGLLPLALPVVSMAVISSTMSTLPPGGGGAVVAASGLPTTSPAAPSKDVTEGVWNKPGGESGSTIARGTNRRGRRAGRGRGRGSRAPLPGQLIALGGGVGVAAQAHLKTAGRRQSVLSGRGGATRGVHSFIGRSPYASASPAVSDSDVMLVSPVSSRPKMAPTRPVSIKEQVAQAAQSEAQLLAAVASITPQSPPESQAPSKITTVSTSNVVRSHMPMTGVAQAVEFLERSNVQQPQQVHYMLHPQQILSSNSSAPIVVGSIGDLSSAPKTVSDVTFATSVMNITSGSLADKRKSIPSIMSNVGDRRKNLASAGTTANKKPIIFQTSGGGLFSTTNRIILPSTVSSVSPNISSLIVSSSPGVVPSLAPIKKLIRPSLGHSTQRMTAPVVLSTHKTVPSFIPTTKPGVTFVNSSKTDSGMKTGGQTSTSERKTLISSPMPGTSFIANQKGTSTLVASHKESTHLPNQKIGVSPQPLPQIIGTLRGGRVSLNSDVVASGVLQGVPTIISGARFISTRGALKGSMTRGGIVQARTLAPATGRGVGVTSRQLITVGGTNNASESVAASSASVTKSHNILLTTLATNISKPLQVSSPLTTDASTCTSPSPGNVLTFDTGKNVSASKNIGSELLPQTPVGVKQLLLELPQGSEKTFKILPQKSQHVIKIADKPQQGHTKILVSSQKAAQICYKPIVVQKKSMVSKVLAQGNNVVQLQPTSQSYVSELPKQVTVSTTTSTTVRISTAANAHRAALHPNTTLILASSVHPSLKCSDSTNPTAPTLVPSRSTVPITATVSLPMLVDQSLSKNAPSSQPDTGSLNDSPVCLTEKLDLLATAASEISQKMIPNQSLGSSEVLPDKYTISDQSKHPSVLTVPLSTLSNVAPLVNKDTDQLIEVSLEEVPKLDVTMSQDDSNNVGGDSNLISLEQYSLKTDAPLAGTSIDKVDSATAALNKSVELLSTGKIATTSDSATTSESYNVDNFEQFSEIKNNSVVPVHPFVTAASVDSYPKISQESSLNSFTEKKLRSIDTKQQFKTIKQDSESSSDVEIIEESSPLQISEANSQLVSKDKSKIILSKSSCSQIKIFSSSSNPPRLSAGSSFTSPQIIVSSQSGKGATIVRPGRSLGTIDGKNITKLTVRPTSAAFKSLSTQPAVIGAKKIIISSGISSRQQNTSSTSISTSSHLTRKESSMVYVTASAESLVQPAVMTVGASEAFSCMKLSSSSSGHLKTSVTPPISLVSISTASADANKPVRATAEKFHNVSPEPIDTDEMKETVSQRASTVQVVSTNEAFSSKASFLNLKKIHISKPCKVQGPIVSESLAMNEPAKDAHATSLPSSSVSTPEADVIQKSESISSSEALHVPAGTKGLQKFDYSVSKPDREAMNLENVPTFSSSSNVRKISFSTVPTKVSLLDVFTSSTVQESLNATSCPTVASPCAHPASEITDEASKAKDTSNADNILDLEFPNDDKLSPSVIPSESSTNDKPRCTSNSNTVPTSSQYIPLTEASNISQANKVDDEPRASPTLNSDPQKFDEQVTPVHSNLSATKSAQIRDADVESEILLEVDTVIPASTTPTSTESTKCATRASVEEHTKMLKTSAIQGSSKGGKGASTRTKNLPVKTQKRHSARLSLTPYEGAAQLRSGRKRST